VEADELVAVDAAIIHSGADPLEATLIRLYERRVRAKGYEPVGLPTVHAKELFKEHKRASLYVTQVTGLGRRIPGYEEPTLDDCEICGAGGQLDDVREVNWHKDGVLRTCITCRANHSGEWSELLDTVDEPT
jgi:hypothetical protein